MAAHWHLEPRYQGYASALGHIIKTEGYCALYHGIKPTLAGIVPYAGCSFAAFHTIKAKLREVRDKAGRSGTERGGRREGRGGEGRGEEGERCTHPSS